MARISRAEMTEKNPSEWQEGATAARAARENVAVQLQDLILDADLTGSPDFVARRVREYAAAKATGDTSVQRAALMELATAAATTAAGLDLASSTRQLSVAA